MRSSCRSRRSRTRCGFSVRTIAPRSPGGRRTPRYTFAHELTGRWCTRAFPRGAGADCTSASATALEAAYGKRAPEIAFELAVHFERGRDRPRHSLLRHRRGIRAPALRQSRSDRLPRGCARRRCAVAGRRGTASPGVELRVALAQPLHELHGFGSERVRENAEAGQRAELRGRKPGGALRGRLRAAGSCMRRAPTRLRSRWRRSWTISHSVSGRRNPAWKQTACCCGQPSTTDVSPTHMRSRSAGSWRSAARQPSRYGPCTAWTP